MSKKETCLNGVSLCAIVRDERMNPAGGIRKFVDSHVPYVEEAVIVDTGSVDGTREILEELESIYPNLKVFDHEFGGYANSRNFSLEKARTEFALILDADELLTHKKPKNDWRNLKKFMEEHQRRLYWFNFKHYTPKGNLTFCASHKERLFSLQAGFYFKRDCFEMLDAWGSKKDERIFLPNEIAIKHFLPSNEAVTSKRKNWYYANDDFCSEEIPSPSSVEGFKQWKQYNPTRDMFE